MILILSTKINSALVGANSNWRFCNALCSSNICDKISAEVDDNQTFQIWA